MSEVTARRILSLSLPIIASNILVPLVGAVDTAMMGHQEDSLLIGATAIGSTVFMFALWSFGFLRMSTGGLVAKAWGAKDGVALRAHFLRATGIALLLGVFVVLCHPWIIALGFKFMPMKAGQESYARLYLQIRLWAGPLALFHFVLMGMLIGMQATRAMFATQLIFNGCNLIFDFITVYGFEMGIEGIAWASVFAEILAVGVGFFFVMKRLRFYPAPFSSWASLLRAKPLLALLRVNTDILIRTQLLLFSFFYFTALGTRQGPMLLAANAILLKLMEFVVYGLDGFAQASESLTGAAIGQKDIQQLHRTISLGRNLSIGMALLSIPILGLSGRYWLSWMTHHQHIIDAAIVYLPWVCIAPIVSVMSYQYDGIFIGAVCSREMRNSMLLSTTAFLLATYTLLPLWGNHGLWLSLMILNAVRGLSLHLSLPKVYEKAAKG